jgi:hypothetical protein
MTHRRTIRAAAPALRTADEDKLLRLIRAIARQAAQEAYKAFINALDRPLTSSGAPSDPTIPQGSESEGTTSEAGQGIGSDERFFSVAEIADQLGLSQKSVRRKRQARADRDPNRESAADRRAQQGRLHRSRPSKQRQ